MLVLLLCLQDKWLYSSTHCKASLDQLYDSVSESDKTVCLSIPENKYLIENKGMTFDAELLPFLLNWKINSD